MGRRKSGALLVDGSLGVLRSRKSRLGDVRRRHLMVSVRGVRSSVMAVRGSGNRRRRPSVARLTVRSIRLLRVLRSDHEGRLLHRSTGESGCAVGLAHARLGVHALERNNASKCGIVGRLLKLGLTRLRAGVV